jgi:NAD(P)-dependent dehydrogenase (short-subunit alcohol dehydrogenase family)
MARTFSAAYVAKGLRFNAVSPGPIETPIWSRKDGTPNGSAESMKAAIAEANPMKRYGTPEEVSAAVTFLLSSESSYVLGAELFVDGGANQL